MRRRRRREKELTATHPSIWLTASGAGRYADGVKRLELARLRVCGRCGKGAAELGSPDGDRVVVPLDAVRARQLSGGDPSEDLRSLTDFVLERLGPRRIGEIVLDVEDGRLRALLSLLGEGDRARPEILACTAEEGVALAIRGGLRLYATDEALAHAAARSSRAPRHGGPDTVH